MTGHAPPYVFCWTIALPPTWLRYDRFAAPGFGRDVGQRLGERPLVAERVLGVVLAFAVLEVGRLHQDAGTMGPRPLAVGTGVLHPHHNRVGGLAGARRTTVAADVADDQGAVAQAQLRAVV